MTVGEYAEDSCDDFTMEKIGLPCWKCVDCGFISQSYTTERCMACGSENTEEVLPTAGILVYEEIGE